MSVPDTVSELSASSVPPLIEILEASVPVSASFIDPAVTVIAPERMLPPAIATGVMLATERLVTVQSASTSSPPELLSAEVLTLSTVIEFSRSLLSASCNTRAFVLLNVPPPVRVSPSPVGIWGDAPV